MSELVYTIEGSSKALLVALINQNQDEECVKEFLDELAFLAETAGAKTLKRYTQKLAPPDVRTYVGSGKMQEIKEFIHQNDIDLLIFDDDLSPAQLRNIEKTLYRKQGKLCRVLDRSDLILDIFAKRARTAHAKTQVELAQYQYLLPRLTGMWTHLERQRGGTGTRGGAGEKEIETDRRAVNNRIALLKKELAHIEKQKYTQRQNRGKMVRVALVGYTNVGKSTLMNLLSKSDVFAENKLFATLDTTVRKVVLQNLPMLLTDTVGFIRKLPHQLIESFKSTLDEVREADLLIHVADIAHPKFEDQVKVVNQTLTDIGAKDKPVILVFNKIDLYKFPEQEEATFDYTSNAVQHHSLSWLKKTWHARTNSACLFISATRKENITELRKVLYDKVKAIHNQRYPYNDFLF